MNISARVILAACVTVATAVTAYASEGGRRIVGIGDPPTAFAPVGDKAATAAQSGTMSGSSGTMTGSSGTMTGSSGTMSGSSGTMSGSSGTMH